MEKPSFIFYLYDIKYVIYYQSKQTILFVSWSEIISRLEIQVREQV